MITLCDKNNERCSQLQFIETEFIDKIKDGYYLKLEVYSDENDEFLFNISIEHKIDDELYSTEDYFETTRHEEAKDLYKTILKMFNKILKSKGGF